jgi:NAD(P)-dependent dehydrogenase (short-subunit alcohol dehydrogenase family)
MGVLANAAVSAAAVAGLRAVSRWGRELDLDHEVVFITGGSRGLGLALAEAFGRRGAQIAMCARTSDDLEDAQRHLAAAGIDAFAVACDVTQADQVASTVELVLERFGRVDVLVNNAGVLEVGPFETLDVEDFDDAMNTMFWGVLHPTLALLPSMRANGGGRIVNVTSIGGKVSFPHLLPYCAAKFAAVGLSEGLHAELARERIRVITIVPGFMRTGSHVNARFKGRPRAEYAWFSLGGTTPITSIDAQRAAGRIVAATVRGDSEVTLSPQAKLAARFVGLFPGLTAEILGVVNRLLPSAGPRVEERPGMESENLVSRSFLTLLGRRAARTYHQVTARSA